MDDLRQEDFIPMMGAQYDQALATARYFLLRHEMKEWTGMAKIIANSLESDDPTLVLLGLFASVGIADAAMSAERTKGENGQDDN